MPRVSGACAFPAPRDPLGPGQRDLRCDQALALRKLPLCPALLGANDPEKRLATQPLSCWVLRPRTILAPRPQTAPGTVVTTICSPPPPPAFHLQEKRGKATPRPVSQLLRVPAAAGGPRDPQETLRPPGRPPHGPGATLPRLPPPCPTSRPPCGGSKRPIRVPSAPWHHLGQQ